MYRLPPNLPLVWTSATSIQVGIDPPRARVDDIPDNAAPLLHALSQGTPASGLAMLARVHQISQDWVDHLVTSLGPALNCPSSSNALRLDLWSTSEALSGLAPLATHSGVEVFLPESITDDTAPTGDAVALIADYLVHPRWADQLSRDNVPHVPVVFSDQTITVGPLVTPGHTPCLVCVESRRRDDMVGWLEVSSQLWGKRSPLHTPANIGMAWALLRVFLTPGGVRDMSPGFSRAAYQASEGSVSWQAVDFHPRCSCRGLTHSA
jgi:hypothetical protein